MTQAADNIQMIDCTRFHTRMSKVGCDRYRSEHPENCKGCDGAGEVVAEVQRTVTPVANKRGRKATGKPSKHKVAACAKCQRVMPLPGRGLCGKCYSAALKAEAAEGGPKRGPHNPAKESIPEAPVIQPAAVAPVAPPCGAQIGQVDWLFDGEDALLAKVKDLARKDRRDVRNEVLCIIEEYLEGAK